MHILLSCKLTQRDDKHKIHDLRQKHLVLVDSLVKGKDKLVRSPRENGGGWDAQKDLHSRTGRDEKKGKTQERMGRGSRKRSSSAGSEKVEKVGGI